MENVKETYEKVHCPYCKNQRLFDVLGGGYGRVRIKCPVCKKEVELYLEQCDKKRQDRMNAYFRKLNRD